MSLEQEIASWDGKSSSDISAVYHRHSSRHGFASKLVKLIESAELQKGATWLIKRYLDDDHGLESSDVAALYKRTADYVCWESRLHILQCIPKMPIGDAEKSMVETFLRTCLTDENKFVRAWAYNGWYEISLQYPEFKQETKQFFDMALRDEAASVQARIRNVMKKGF